MAGHIAGLGYSQRIDANGRPESGWKLYIYETGTSTPVDTFSDYALSLDLPHPIEADSAGMMPMFWVDDGTYRVRGTDSDGNELFDDDGIVALGPSSGTGGAAASVDSDAIAATGDFNWQPVSGTRSGWVRANARTIGSAASGGTERANADCENLFLFLWNTFADSFCPVTGGRGGSAAADWAANKVIATLDMRSKGSWGLDDMGNSSAGITGASTIAATAVGASTYTIATANLPNISLSSTGLSITVSTLKVLLGTSLQAVEAGTPHVGVGGSGDDLQALSTLVSSTVSGTIPLGGSGTDIDILTPMRVGTWYIRL